MYMHQHKCEGCGESGHHSEQMHQSKKKDSYEQAKQSEINMKRVELKINFSTSGYWLRLTKDKLARLRQLITHRRGKKECRKGTCSR